MIDPNKVGKKKCLVFIGNPLEEEATINGNYTQQVQNIQVIIACISRPLLFFSPRPLSNLPEIRIWTVKDVYPRFNRRDIL